MLTTVSKFSSLFRQKTCSISDGISRVNNLSRPQALPLSLHLDPNKNHVMSFHMRLMLMWFRTVHHRVNKTAWSWRHHFFFGILVCCLNPDHFRECFVQRFCYGMWRIHLDGFFLLIPVKNLWINKLMRRRKLREHFKWSYIMQLNYYVRVRR